MRVLQYKQIDIPMPDTDGKYRGRLSRCELITVNFTRPRPVTQEVSNG